MPRPFGSKNRTKIPKASELVKYASQNLQDSVIYLEGIINSKDPTVSIKNKLDAIKLNKELLDMAGYGKELEAGRDKIISDEGEVNRFRGQSEQLIPTQPQPVSEEQEEEKKTPALDSLLGRYEGE